MRLVTVIVTLLLLTTACIPALFGHGSVDVTAVRAGDQVTATVVVDVEVTDLQVHWSNPIDESHRIFDADGADPVPAGTYTDTVTSVEPVDCSATGNIDGRFFRESCRAP